MEILNSPLKIVNGLLKLLLLQLHLFHKPHFVLLQLLVSLLHDCIDLFGRAKDNPPFIQFILCKSIVEFLEYSVDFKAL